MDVLIEIGNSDDKLSQIDWSGFCDEVSEELLLASTQVYGVWYSIPNSAYQNAAWHVNLSGPYVKSVKQELRHIAHKYNQDSIAWSETPVTVFLKGEKRDVVNSNPSM